MSKKKIKALEREIAEEKKQVIKGTGNLFYNGFDKTVRVQNIEPLIDIKNPACSNK